MRLATAVTRSRSHAVPTGGLWQRLGGRGPFLAGPGLLDPRLRHGHQPL